MTINEFRAWLDGFKEAVVDAPTPEQWAKVLEKLETVQAFPPVLPTPQPSIADPFRSPSIPSSPPNWGRGEIPCRNDSATYTNGQNFGPTN